MPDQSNASPPSGGRWDGRYNSDDYFFGTEPNTFLTEVTDRLPPGRALFLADGEGRNSVYLARKGWECTSMDASRVGNQKAQALANQAGVTIETVHADLRDYDIGHEEWDVVVSIFCHLPPALRRDVHRRVVAGLKPGGAVVLEAYRPEQLQYGTGGPPDETLMISEDVLREDFAGLQVEHCVQAVRNVTEGRGHTGRAAVVQFLAIKPV